VKLFRRYNSGTPQPNADQLKLKIIRRTITLIVLSYNYLSRITFPPSVFLSDKKISFSWKLSRQIITKRQGRSMSWNCYSMANYVLCTNRHRKSNFTDHSGCIELPWQPNELTIFFRKHEMLQVQWCSQIEMFISRKNPCH
jgi:hypothetical protein